MDHRAGDHVEDQVDLPGAPAPLLRREFAAALGAVPAEHDQAFLAVHDGAADPVAQRVVVRGLGDHRHQRGLGLRAFQQPGELQHHVLGCRRPGCRGRAVSSSSNRAATASTTSSFLSAQRR